MNSRERLLTVLSGKMPDCVPCAPDISNMVPAKLTGKPFWDIYLYNDPPIWEAYIEAAKYFDLDSLMDGYFYLEYPFENQSTREYTDCIIFKSEERLITQAYWMENGKRTWAPTVNVYYIDNPPNMGVPPEKVRLPAVPEKWEPVEGVKPVDHGPEGLKKMKQLMGDQGLVGVSFASSLVIQNEEMIYDYFDNPEKYKNTAEKHIKQVEKRFEYIMSLEEKPDFLCVGASGTLVFQTPEIFRKLAFPAVKRAIDLASEAGMMTQIHSCGPEKELIKIMAEETNLTVIDPLELPTGGDCILKEIKQLYGDKIVLKGNLHTTDTMLIGSAQDVIEASKKAIDDAAEGGRFILSTGDQCGRETPEENLRAMIETARTYGKY